MQRAVCGTDPINVPTKSSRPTSRNRRNTSAAVRRQSAPPAKPGARRRLDRLLESDGEMIQAVEGSRGIDSVLSVDLRAGDQVLQFRNIQGVWGQRTLGWRHLQFDVSAANVSASSVPMARAKPPSRSAARPAWTPMAGTSNGAPASPHRLLRPAPGRIRPRIHRHRRGMGQSQREKNNRFATSSGHFLFRGDDVYKSVGLLTAASHGFVSHNCCWTSPTCLCLTSRQIIWISHRPRR